MSSTYMISHASEVKAEAESKIRAVLFAIGATAEGYAKEACPVDTGRLRASITHAEEGLTVYIGTNVEYAAPVEYGTSRMQAKPYLKPAIADHLSEYKDYFESAGK